jgi:hypothetical protein
MERVTDIEWFVFRMEFAKMIARKWENFPDV